MVCRLTLDSPLGLGPGFPTYKWEFGRALFPVPVPKAQPPSIQSSAWIGFRCCPSWSRLWATSHTPRFWACCPSTVACCQHLRKGLEARWLCCFIQTQHFPGWRKEYVGQLGRGEGCRKAMQSQEGAHEGTCSRPAVWGRAGRAAGGRHAGPGRAAGAEPSSPDGGYEPGERDQGCWGMGWGGQQDS